MRVATKSGREKVLTSALLVALRGVAAAGLVLGCALPVPMTVASAEESRHAGRQGLAPLVGGPALGVAPVSGEAPQVRISVQRPEIAVNVGAQFELPTTITNVSGQPLSGLIAHLDVLGTDPQRYVDPEDWCTERTVFLAPLGPGESVPHSWPMQAVDSGPLLVWVTVTRAEGRGVAVSEPARLTVGEHIDVNAEGVLPLVVVVPAVLFGSAAALSWRRRRLGDGGNGPASRPV